MASRLPFAVFGCFENFAHFSVIFQENCKKPLDKSCFTDYNRLVACESGGTGRRARLRGVWILRTGSSPVSRTTKKTGHQMCPVFFCVGRDGTEQSLTLFFVLKTVHRTVLFTHDISRTKKVVSFDTTFLSKSQTWYIIECITRLWRDIHSYIITL